MLPKRFRLSKEEFQEVRGKGRLVSGKFMGILIQASGFAQPDNSKAGLIVSKKISNKAVVRNKLKRRLRAALQATLPLVSPTFHIVILPNKKSVGVTVKELEEEIKRLLNG